MKKNEETVDVEVEQYIFDMLSKKAEELGMNVNDYVSEIVNKALADGTLEKILKKENNK